MCSNIFFTSLAERDFRYIRRLNCDLVFFFSGLPLLALALWSQRPALFLTFSGSVRLQVLTSEKRRFGRLQFTASFFMLSMRLQEKLMASQHPAERFITVIDRFVLLSGPILWSIHLLCAKTQAPSNFSAPSEKKERKKESNFGFYLCLTRRWICTEQTSKRNWA